MTLKTQRKEYALMATAAALGRVDERIFEKIRGIFLFGSVAAGTATEESDVDIFFDVDIPQKSQAILRRKLQHAYEEFRMSPEGLISRCRGIKIGKSAAAIPKATSSRFDELISKHGIQHTVREFYR